MSDRTGIEVTEATWNPITGCSPASPGCRRCYAKRFAHRLKGRYGYPLQEPFAVTVHPQRMDQPLRWKKPRHIFAGSMGDLFHQHVTPEALRQVFETMAATPRHTYMIITKRPHVLAQRLAGLDRELLAALQKHVWMGVSVETREYARERVPLLLASWRGLCFACCEPLLGEVDLTPWLSPSGNSKNPGLQWVICGGETGPGAQQAPFDAVRSLRDQCLAAGTPFFFKHWGGPDRKRTGRHLEGRLFEQMPPWKQETPS